MRAYGIVKKSPNKFFQKSMMIKKDSPKISIERIELNREATPRKEIMKTHQIVNRGKIIKVSYKQNSSVLNKSRVSQLSRASARINFAQSSLMPNNSRKHQSSRSSSGRKKIFASREVLPITSRLVSEEVKAMESISLIENKIDQIKKQEETPVKKLPNAHLNIVESNLKNQNQNIQVDKPSEQIELEKIQKSPRKTRIFQRSAEKSYQYSKQLTAPAQTSEEIGCCGTFFMSDKNQSENEEEKAKTNMNQLEQQKHSLKDHKKKKIFEQLTFKNNSSMPLELEKQRINQIENKQQLRMTPQVRALNERNNVEEDENKQKQLKEKGKLPQSFSRQEQASKLHLPQKSIKLKKLNPLIVSSFSF